MTPRPLTYLIKVRAAVHQVLPFRGAREERPSLFLSLAIFNHNLQRSLRIEFPNCIMRNFIFIDWHKRLTMNFLAFSLDE